MPGRTRPWAECKGQSSRPRLSTCPSAAPGNVTASQSLSVLMHRMGTITSPIVQLCQYKMTCVDVTHYYDYEGRATQGHCVSWVNFLNLFHSVARGPQDLEENSVTCGREKSQQDDVWKGRSEGRGGTREPPGQWERRRGQGEEKAGQLLSPQDADLTGGAGGHDPGDRPPAPLRPAGVQPHRRVLDSPPVDFQASCYHYPLSPPFCQSPGAPRRLAPHPSDGYRNRTSLPTAVIRVKRGH